MRSLLDAVFYGHPIDPDSPAVQAAIEAGWLTDGLDITPYGEIVLGELWGPETTPPWAGGACVCYRHGLYDTAPGEPAGCPNCL